MNSFGLESSTSAESCTTRLEEHNVYYDLPVRPVGETPAKKPNLWRKMAAWSRPAFVLDHLDYRSLKVVLPTFLQVWISVILVVIPRSGAWFDNASYLMLVLGFICSAGGFSICINVIVSFACFTAVVIGWLFVIVAQAIGASIRGWPSQKDFTDAMIAEGSCTQENISKCMLRQYYTGRYMQANVTVVFSIAFVLGVFFLGLLMRIHKMAKLVYVSGCLSIIINTCYAISIPTFSPLAVGLSVVRPAGFAFILKILVSCVVFPFTSSFKYFDVSTEVLSTLLRVSARNEKFFMSMKPSEDNFNNYCGLSKDIQATRVRLSAIQVFLSSTRFEVSYGRFSSSDANEFSSRIKSLLNTYSGYEYFYLQMEERKEILKEVFYPRNRHGSLSNRDTSGQSKLFTAFSHTYKEVGKLEDSKVRQLFRRKYLNENTHEPTSLKDLDIVTDHVKEAHACYLSEISNSIKVARDWLADANEFRVYSIFNLKKHTEKQKLRHEELVQARKRLQEFMTIHEEAQNDLSLKMLEGMEGHEQILSLISQTSFFLFLSKQAASQLLALHDFFLSIDEKRPCPVFIWPRKSLQAQSAIAFFQKVEEKSPISEPHCRDPDTLPPQTTLQLVMWAIFKVYKAILSEDYGYWLHCALLANFCVFPFYFKTSAPLFLNWKLVWFPIMCTVSMSQYSADSIYVFGTKLVYTIIGAFIGVVAWYISTGLGNGNYYGYTVVCTVVFFFTTYYKHFSVHTLPVAGLMICLTPALVLGTSWNDSQYHVSDVGVGWRVGAVRCVSMIAGLSVAFTTTFFPRVRSSKASLRKKMATCFESLNEIQSALCNFALERYDDPDIHIRQVDDKLSSEIRGVLLRLAVIRGGMKSIKYETPLTGTWPTEKYEKLHGLLVSITQLYFLHYRLLDQVEDTDAWIPHMVNRAAWNQPEFLSQMVSLVYMAAESLRLKISLPEITTATLSITHLEVLSEMWGTQGVSLNERVYAERRNSESSQLRRRALKKLDFDNLLSRDGRLNVVALIITHMIYKQIDQAVLVTKGLVGEKYNFDMRLFDF